MSDEVILRLVTSESGYKYNGDDKTKKGVAMVINNMEKVLSDGELFSNLPAKVAIPFKIMVAMWMNVLGDVIDENWESYLSEKQKKSV